MQAGIPSCYFQVGMDGCAVNDNGVLWGPLGGAYYGTPLMPGGNATYTPSNINMPVPSLVFDNSRVSPVYGRSDSVVPNSRTCKFLIRYM